MTVKALMPVRNMDLVAPLGHKPTDRHTTDTVAPARGASGAAALLIGHSLRRGGVNSATGPLTPGIATSTTATRTTTTGRGRPVLLPSADPDLFALLVQAYLDCRRNKRGRASAQAFEARAEHRLFDLYERLAGGHWRPGRSICFVVHRPRPREVWAAPFEDRIVHHLLYNQVAARFQASFLADSCACIPGRGTLYGARRLERHVRSCTHNWSRPAYYLKLDLANFFVSIDKRALRDQLRRRITEPWWRSLAETILMHDPRGDVLVRGRPSELALVPPHKSLFNAPPDHGLPIGNLPSQFCANVLLDELDQHIKHRLRAPWYVRYVDDMVLLHPSAQWLGVIRQQIAAKLADLHLQLNPRKTILQPVARGVDFVGQVIRPWRRTTRRTTLVTALQRLMEMPAADTYASGNSYLSLVRQATHNHAERVALCRTLLRRGHPVDGLHLSKVFRRENHV
jgi:hypothetical protein